MLVQIKVFSSQRNYFTYIDRELKVKMKLKQIAAKILFWLTMEILLSFIGIDYLADYGEFIGIKNSMKLIH